MPQQPTSALSTFTITVNNQPLPDTFQIYSILIEQATYAIPSASITIFNGNAGTGQIDDTVLDLLTPGNAISISVGYNANNTLAFNGVITEQTFNSDEQYGAVLTISANDLALQTAYQQKAVLHQTTNLSVLFKTIINNYAKLQAVVEDNSLLAYQQIQNQQSDWDFLCQLAKKNGYLVNVLNGTIGITTLKAPAPKLILNYGDALLAVNLTTNAANQIAVVKAAAWDWQTKTHKEVTTTNTYVGPGSYSATTLANALENATYETSALTSCTEIELQQQNLATLTFHNLSKTVGTIKTVGNLLANTGDHLTIYGCGSQFNGDYYVSGVKQLLQDGNWITTYQLGLALDKSKTANQAASFNQSMFGVYTGVVMTNDNTTNGFIKVALPSLVNGDKGLLVAAIGSTTPTAQAGDEVVIGFTAANADFPVLLSTTRTANATAPLVSTTASPHETNATPLSTSAADSVIQFATPQGRTIELNDTTGSISFQDAENSIVLNAQGISIKSNGAITISAAQGANVSSSGGDLQLSGINIKATANVQLNLEATATATLNGGGETTIKGAMVLIN